MAAISRLITMRGHPAAESTPGAANVRRMSFRQLCSLLLKRRLRCSGRANGQRFFSKWRSLQLCKLGITPPCQRIPISTRANLALGRLVRIYRGMPNPWLGPDRPLTPDSIPRRRNGRPHGANPNAVSDRVPGSAPGLARIGDDIFEQQMHSKG
jgi:hypothetical protein